MKYLDKTNNETKQYYKILSKEFPEFLKEYIETPAMLRLDGISMLPGCDYTNIIKIKYFNSRLKHSIGVALIIWNFTKDKKQALAGLFHDIATPAFSHIVDFMHGDYLNQESTEDLTKYMIENSKEIMQLLSRDKIKVEEVCDYHMYSIADNDTPMLSADRLEYTFSDGLQIEGIFNLDSINRVYSNLEVLKKENNELELGFKNVECAEEFVINANKLWKIVSTGNEINLIMQFWTDYLKKLIDNKYIKEQDLYKMSEQEVINKIKEQDDINMINVFNKFQNSTKIGRSNIEIKDKYCTDAKGKRRYINPLVNTDKKIARVTEISNTAKEIIEKVKVFEDSKYAYLDFEF
ncbi:MAG: HD domain-containing protein [Clostridia bacterium]|nr:HD domain-containing protein [Clostridia bacterium]